MTKINFSKMQGVGNDFIIINALNMPDFDFAAIAKKYSDRRFGIGFDQMLVVKPAQSSDFKMLIFNADGSEVEMCGNGIRCFAKYLRKEGLTTKEELIIETAAGLIKPKIVNQLVEVDMGEPELFPAKIPVRLEGMIIHYPYTFQEQTLPITCVSMGNPHCVIFVDEVHNYPVTAIGPIIENHEIFPKRTNVEFAQVVDESNIQLRVWERGAGETLACGTGACATLVAGVLNGLCQRTANIHLKGGTLKVHWNEQDNHVFMTGPGEFVFDGEIDI